MPMIKAEIIGAFIVIVLVSCMIAFVAAASSGIQGHPAPSSGNSTEESRFLHASEDRIVKNDNGKEVEVRLRGVNIGSWLLIEPWIINAWNGFDTEKDIWDFIARNETLSEQQRLDLINSFRDNWFTEDDVENIAAAGMNCVRLPIWYRAITDPDYGGNHSYNFTYVDRCIGWCKKNSLYVILDLHGAPGGQNTDITTGERTNADLWKNSDYKIQTVKLWKAIAEKYKDNSTVAGYDLLNEAVPDKDGNNSTDDFNDMIELYNEIYTAIRTDANDSKHIIILECGLSSNNLERMPFPKDKGWENVIYSFHYHLTKCTDPYEAQNICFPRLRAIDMYYEVPIYVGEFNTVQIDVKCDHPYISLNISERLSFLQEYRDIFDYYGWSWTFWTYKKIEEDRDGNWGLYMNDAPALDFKNDSLETLTEAFRSLRTDNTGINQDLLDNLTKPPSWKIPMKQVQDGADLTMRNAVLMRSQNSDLQVRWNRPLPNAGNWTKGDTISWKFAVNASDVYEITICRSNNVTNNTVALWIDGVLAAEVPLHYSGGWNRYVNDSLRKYHLGNGSHMLALSQADNDTAKDFLNVRSVSVRRSPGNSVQLDGREINLTPAANFLPQTPIRIEWFNDPPNFAHWAANKKVDWLIRLDRLAKYDVRVEYATPNNNTTFNLYVDGKKKLTQPLKATNSYGEYNMTKIGEVSLFGIEHNISATWETSNGDAGNLRGVYFRRK